MSRRYEVVLTLVVSVMADSEDDAIDEAITYLDHASIGEYVDEIDVDVDFDRGYDYD